MGLEGACRRNIPEMKAAGAGGMVSADPPGAGPVRPRELLLYRTRDATGPPHGRGCQRMAMRARSRPRFGVQKSMMRSRRSTGSRSADAFRSDERSARRSFALAASPELALDLRAQPAADRQLGAILQDQRPLALRRATELARAGEVDHGRAMDPGEPVCGEP